MSCTRGTPSTELDTPALRSSRSKRAARSGESRLAFVLGVWLALVGGFTEVAIAGVRRAVLHEFVLTTPDTAWMAPLTNLLITGLLVGALGLVSHLWPRLPVLRLGAWVGGFVAISGPLLMATFLTRPSALLLAAGLATQVSWVATKYACRLEAVVDFALGWPLAIGGWLRRTGHRWAQSSSGTEAVADRVLTRRQALLGACATIAGIGVGLHAWDGVVEAATLLRLPTAAPRAPNLLWVVMDTVRAASLSLHGYARATTPNLERLAQRGVRFDRALAPTSWTLPSHASMFTGQYPHDLDADWGAAMGTSQPTISAALSEQGYATAAFVANTYYGNPQYGLGLGFDHYEHFAVTPGQLVLGSSLGRSIASADKLWNRVQYHDILNRRRAEDVNAELRRWLSTAPGQRPFFAFLNYYDAHDPYLPPPPYDTLFGPLRPRGPYDYELEGSIARSDRQAMTPDQIQTELDAYEGSIAYIDHQVGALFDDLDRRGLLDNTLLIVTSDHGEEFGEHGEFEHGTNLFMTSIHVPLLVAFGDRVPHGLSVTAPVSLRDLPATVLDLLGAPNRGFTGESLSRFWRGGSTPADETGVLSELTGWNSRLMIFGRQAEPDYPFGRNNIDSVLKDDFHYLRDGRGREELFHILSDPAELTNLVDDSTARPQLLKLRNLLATKRSAID